MLVGYMQVSKAGGRRALIYSETPSGVEARS